LVIAGGADQLTKEEGETTQLRQTDIQPVRGDRNLNERERKKKEQIL